MKVRFASLVIVPWDGRILSFYPDQIYDISEVLAEALQGLYEPVEVPVEEAFEKPPKDKMVRKAKKKAVFGQPIDIEQSNEEVM